MDYIVKSEYYVADILSGHHEVSIRGFKLKFPKHSDDFVL